MIEIVAAPPFLTVQDRGRFGFRASGVPVSGAMDVDALDAANRAVGNDPHAAALEWALGGGVIRFIDAHAVALAGAEVEATLSDATLTIDRIVAGRFLYIAVAGGIDVPVVLGSRSTYVPGRFGGHEGRLLRSGDRLQVGTAPPSRADAPALRQPERDAPLRVIRGPDVHRFTAEGWRTFVSEPFRLGVASDRTGYRLEGPSIERVGRDDGPSTPVCPGVVQVPPNGQPLVLMADAPTVGGYPIIAVLTSGDVSRLAQCNPGDTIRFDEITGDTAGNS
jgi:biotin-dependent carboxylase-like uncharacterized protein